MSTTDLPCAWGGPTLRGRLRAVAEDFEVEELPSFEPSGDGEHHWLWIEKRGANTEWLARQLATFAGVAAVDVGFAGRKDRHALTRQAFTVRLPGRPEFDWSAFVAEGVRVLGTSRHARKLGRGSLAGNRFTLRIRDVEGDVEQAVAQFEQIKSLGMPNYFGEQRFGSGGGNLAAAEAMFAGRRVRRDEREMLLSAARSVLFNDVLAARVGSGHWNVGLEGEVWQLEGSASIFGPEPATPELVERAEQGDIHPTGVMWGKGALRTQAEVARLEQACAAARAGIAAGLERAGVGMARRSLRVMPKHMVSDREGPHWTLRFELPPGSYATSLLRELIMPMDGGP